MREILTQQSNDQKTNSAQDTNATIKQTRKQVVREWYNQVLKTIWFLGIYWFVLGFQMMTLKKTTKLRNGSLNHSYIGPDTSENTVAKSQIVLVLYALVWEG